MSLDPSLKTGGNLVSNRSVLKRHERIDRLKETVAFDPQKKPVLGLQKTLVRKGA